MPVRKVPYFLGAFGGFLGTLMGLSVGNYPVAVFQFAVFGYCVYRLAGEGK